MRQKRNILAFDIIIEIINFLNKRTALHLVGASRIFKICVEKLPFYPSFARIIPKLNITTQFIGARNAHITYSGRTYVVLRPINLTYDSKTMVRKPIPLAPPSTDIVGFSNISLDFFLGQLLQFSEYIKDIRIFFQNIKHLITSSTHYLHVDFDFSDDAYSHTFSEHKQFSKVYEIPRFNIFLDWLNLFGIASFLFVNITSSESILFSNSARSLALLSLLLNSAHIRNVKFLQIQSNFYCCQHCHHDPCIFPLQFTSIAKWLFISETPKIIRFFNEDNPGKLDCICPIERCLIPMLKTLLKMSNRINYSYLIIHPTCIHCFNFILVARHSKLSNHLKNILVYTEDYLSIWLHTGVEYSTEKFELFWRENNLYIRRSPLYGPIEKVLDPKYCMDYFETNLSQKHSIEVGIRS